MTKAVGVIGVGFVLLCLGGCAAGSTDAHIAAAGGAIPQFFLGLWHGFIAPITLIAEIVNWIAPGVLPWRPHFFETGLGAAYDLGFFLTVTGGPHVYIRTWRSRRA